MSGQDPAVAALLEDVAGHLADHVVMSPEQRDALALYVLHTHTIEAADFTPYVLVTSAERSSGKSLLLQVLAGLVHEPRMAASTSAAATYRLITQRQPTLLIDELDTVFGQARKVSDEAEDMRRVLNAGFSRHGGRVMRCEGPRSTLVEFEVFCPKVLAGIGSLPDTIESRSIPIRLKRKTADEVVASSRRRDLAPREEVLRERLEAWAAGAPIDALAGFRIGYDLPIGDRAAEIWEPLAAIADLAGGGWPARVNRAAVTLSGDRFVSVESVGVRLLADIREVFTATDARSMHSGPLCVALNEMEESGWGAWSEGVGIAPRDVARIMRDYDVAPRGVKIDGRVAKGYQRAELEDAWARYLHPSDGVEVTGESAGNPEVTPLRYPETADENGFLQRKVTGNPRFPGGPDDVPPEDIERWEGMAGA